MLVKHPVPLLLVFLCLKVRTMKLSNAREASSSAAARFPLPEGENHETAALSFFDRRRQTEQCPLAKLMHVFDGHIPRVPEASLLCKNNPDRNIPCICDIHIKSILVQNNPNEN